MVDRQTDRRWAGFNQRETEAIDRPREHAVFRHMQVTLNEQCQPTMQRLPVHPLPQVERTSGVGCEGEDDRMARCVT